MNADRRAVTRVRSVAVMTARATMATALAVLVGCAPQVRDANSVGRSRAAEWLQRATAADARLERARALSFVDSALAADRHAFLPVFWSWQLVGSGDSRLAWALSLRAAESRSDPGVARCLQRHVHRAVGLTPPPPAGRPSDVAIDCEIVAELYYKSAAPGFPAARVADVMRRFARDPMFAITGAAPAAAVRDMVELERIGRALVSRATDHVSRAYGFGLLVTALHETGRHDEAMRLERSMPSDPQWSLPAFRVRWGLFLKGHGFFEALTGPSPDSSFLRHATEQLAASAEIVEEAAAHGDALARFTALMEIGVMALDRGWLPVAIDRLSRAVADGLFVGDAGLVAHAQMRLGRAQVKAGRLADAERSLLAARAMADSLEVPLIRKEIEHNLLHLYESLGRDQDALRAGREFVRWASNGELNSVRMMSHRDLAMFHRARGRYRDSDREFRQMVAKIDSLGTNRYFAGEYFELVGDLPAAARYYTLAQEQSDIESVRALQGLSRVAMALGDTGAALRFAATHDGRRDAAGWPESYPIRPLMLAGMGRTDEARAAFAAARAIAAQNGQRAAWTMLTTDLAALELAAGSVPRAAALADSARAGARDAAAAEASLRAEAIGAFARWRLTADRQAARHALTDIATRADRSTAPLVRSEIHALVATSVAQDGDWRAALSWYARAATAVDSMALTIALDPTRAAFRSAQRRVYNEALTTIAANGDHPAAAAAFLEWSQRRKGRSYALPVARGSERGRIRSVPGAAIVDYVVTDTLIAAAVIRADRTELYTLGPTAPQVRDAIHRIRAGVNVRVGTTLDVRRARVPLQAAHELYALLVAPLEPALTGVQTLVVVPDGVLHLVPFDALVTETPDPAARERDARYLMDRFTIVTATSPAVTSDAWRVARGPVVVVAPTPSSDAVPGAATELGALTRAVSSGRLSVLSGRAASRTGVTKALQSAAVVHFVTHASANERAPGESWIQLAGEHGGHDLLRASEAASLRADGALVVLAACESAAGRVLEGEGVLSLSRGFLQAGATATVATLWPIGPLAADFAEEFHSRVSRTSDAADALRGAKMALRQRGLPPFAWAPYQLVVAPPAAAGARHVAIAP